MPTTDDIRARLIALGDSDDAAFLLRFFKTAPGEYGHGDRFLGIRVPVLRRLARELRGLSIDDMVALVHEPWHEARSLAVMMLADAYARGAPKDQGAIYAAYLANTDRINNWDLVDASAGQIVGAHLARRSRAPLRKLARSTNLWERRIAIIATSHFIRLGEFVDTLELAQILMHDKHDLMHKAVGWMLREVGNRDRATLESFLDQHAAEMPRTMLRYSLERLPERTRRTYMGMRGLKAATSD